MGLGSVITSTIKNIASSPKGTRVAVGAIAATGVAAVAITQGNKIYDSVSGSLKSSNIKTADDKAKSSEKSNEPIKTADHLRYPMNVGEVNRYPHFITFHINANSKSKIIKEGTEGKSYVDLTNEGRTTHGKESGVQSITSGAKEFISRGDNTPLIGNITKGTNATIDKFAASHKRLIQSIILPMPMDVNVAYGTDYTAIGTGGILGSFFHGLANGNGIEGAIGDTAVGAIQSALTYGSANIGARMEQAGTAKVPGIPRMNDARLRAAADQGAAKGAKYAEALKPVVEKALGLAVNERLEQMFKSVNFRDFTFEWLFAPRDETESQTIKQIIDKFKYHMMPELSSGNNMYFLMPDEFDIEMRFRTPGSGTSSENKFIHKIMTSALIDVRVNYSPTGKWSTFENGAPTMIQLSLHFREMEPLVRQMVDRGF